MIASICRVRFCAEKHDDRVLSEAQGSPSLRWRVTAERDAQAGERRRAGWSRRNACGREVIDSLQGVLVTNCHGGVETRLEHGPSRG